MLRKRNGTIRLRLVNAQFPAAESVAEIGRCRAAAAAAGLADAIEWHTDFLPDNESRSLLSDCDIIVLPYQFSKEGSSAALRMAMSTGVPVAVTPLPLFDEAESAVFRFHGLGSNELADGIAFLLGNPEQREAIKAQARLWLESRNWALIARRFQGMLRGLSTNWALPAAYAFSPAEVAVPEAASSASSMASV